jgi:hypothetical protein
MAAMTRSERHHLARRATEVRHRCLRDGLAPEVIVEVICREVPQMFALEAWRLAPVGAEPKSQHGSMGSTKLTAWLLLASLVPSCAVGSTGSAGRAMKGSSTCAASIRRDQTGLASGWTTATLW